MNEKKPCVCLCVKMSERDVIKPNTLWSVLRCVLIESTLSTVEIRIHINHRIGQAKLNVTITLSESPSLTSLPTECRECVRPWARLYNLGMWLTKEGVGRGERRRVVMGGWDAEERGWKAGEWQVLLWPKCRSLQQQGQRSMWSWKVNLNSQEAHPERGTDKGESEK